jgi:hemoglobin
MGEMMQTDYERLGGEKALRHIIRCFVDRVYGDVIIGFLFRSIDKERLIEREIEFASLHLGGPHVYTGRSIREAHQRHPINRGHFHRRLWILEQVLLECEVESDIIEKWLHHNRVLESLVTDGSDCVPAS